jgi:ribosomal protein L24E
MPKCFYCGKTYEWPRGLTLVDNLGHVKPLCSSKCYKYAGMKRKKGKWAISKGKDMIEEETQVEKVKHEKTKK